MNEIRYKIILNMAGNPKPKDEEDWEELIRCFKRLQLQIKLSNYADIFKEITAIIKSMESNNPKPKIYRAKKKRLAELESMLNTPKQQSR